VKGPLYIFFISQKRDLHVTLYFHDSIEGQPQTHALCASHHQIITIIIVVSHQLISLYFKNLIIMNFIQVEMLKGKLGFMLYSTKRMK
jgi:hypothetical protein